MTPNLFHKRRWEAKYKIQIHYPNNMTWSYGLISEARLLKILTLMIQLRIYKYKYAHHTFFLYDPNSLPPFAPHDFKRYDHIILHVLNLFLKYMYPSLII